MTKHSERPHPDGAEAGAEELLADLEALLSEQIRQARTGNVGELESSVSAAGKLLHERLAAAPGGQSAARRQRILKLYDELCLILKAQKAELGDKLEHMRRGKLSVRAYQPGPP